MSLLAWIVASALFVSVITIVAALVAYLRARARRS